MIFTLQFFFYASIGLLIYSYLIYPTLVNLLARNKKNNQEIYDRNHSLPFVFVCIAAYNEEQVIKEKLESLFNQNYPTNKIQYFIGSDCSSDGTNAILKSIEDERKDFRAVLMQERTGKPGVINKLIEHCKLFCEKQNLAFDEQILLFTDANVILAENTLFELVKHFKNSNIDLVDAHLRNSKPDGDGISNSETTYIGREVSLKHKEGKLWQCLMGTFGACFAMRASAYREVPSNFVVDDFYLSLKVLESGKGAISELNALCYEVFPEAIEEEFRRKTRISSGNFQNLFAFKHLLNPFKKIGFVFISHKAIRYIGPFLILIGVTSATVLYFLGLDYIKYALLAMLIWFILIPLMDYILDKTTNFKTGILRSIRYFNLMNLALLFGYNKFRNGIKSNAWEPTKRN